MHLLSVVDDEPMYTLDCSHIRHDMITYHICVSGVLHSGTWVSSVLSPANDPCNTHLYLSGLAIDATPDPENTHLAWGGYCFAITRGPHHHSGSILDRQSKRNSPLQTITSREMCVGTRRERVSSGTETTGDGSRGSSGCLPCPCGSRKHTSGHLSQQHRNGSTRDTPLLQGNASREGRWFS